VNGICHARLLAWIKVSWRNSAAISACTLSHLPEPIIKALSAMSNLLSGRATAAADAPARHHMPERPCIAPPGKVAASAAEATPAGQPRKRRAHPAPVAWPLAGDGQINY
jgi:hypothetical protein